MAHYAQVNSSDVVVQVLVMDNDKETNEGESACIAWLQANVHADDWVKTSYNNNIVGMKTYTKPTILLAGLRLKNREMLWLSLRH